MVVVPSQVDVGCFHFLTPLSICCCKLQRSFHEVKAYCRAGIVSSETDSYFTLSSYLTLPPLPLSLPQAEGRQRPTGHHLRPRR